MYRIIFICITVGSSMQDRATDSVVAAALGKIIEPPYTTVYE